MKIRFWAFEILNIIFLTISNIKNNNPFDEVIGRIKGILAIINGYKDYNAWVSKKMIT